MPLRLQGDRQLRVLPSKRADRRLRRITLWRARAEAHGQVVELGQKLLFPGGAGGDGREAWSHRGETARRRANHSGGQINGVDGGRLQRAGYDGLYFVGADLLPFGDEKRMRAQDRQILHFRRATEVQS